MKIKKYKCVGIGLVMLIFTCPSILGSDPELKNEFSKKDTSSYLQISGIVLDNETDKPMVYANIFLNGTNIGTVTNSDGEFILKIPADKSQKQIAITILGYKSQLLSLNEFSNETKIIKLQPTSIELDEVVIKNVDPFQLIRKALNSIKNNYSNEPERQIGFYRETIKQNKNYVSVAEAVLNVYKSAYSNQVDIDRVKLFKGRKSHDVKKMDTLLFKLQGGPRTSYLLDIVKNPENILSYEMLDAYSYKLNGIVTIDDKEVYVIDFNQIRLLDLPLYNGQIYIDVKSSAFVGFNFHLNEKNIDLAQNVLVKKKPANLNINILGANYLVKYRETDGKWYLNYVRSELAFKCKWNKKLFTSNYTTTLEMAVTDRSEVDVEKFKFKESAKESDVLADQVNYFNDDNYWGTYNYIKPDESIENAIAKMNKKLKLDNK